MIKLSHLINFGRSAQKICHATWLNRERHNYRRTYCKTWHRSRSTEAFCHL